MKAILRSLLLALLFAMPVLVRAQAPTTQATVINFTGVTGTAATINWTNGNGAARTVFVKAGSTTTFQAPTASTTYTASTTFSSGTQIAASGWYCVYNGTGSSVAISGLTANSSYTVEITEYNGAAGAETYSTTATGVGNPIAFTTSALIAWDFAGQPGNQSTAAATQATQAAANINVTSSTVSRGATLTATTAGSALTSSGFLVAGSTNSGTTFTADSTAAIAGGKYVQLTIAPNAGYALSLNTLDANFRKSATGPSFFIWKYSTDGFTTSDNAGTFITFSTAVANTGTAQTQINLSGIRGLQNTTSTVTFRVYGWGGSGTAGTFGLGTVAGPDITVGGTVAPPVYYSKATGDLSVLSTYGTNADGSGTAPTDFNGSGANATYQLANRGLTYTLTSDLTIGSTFYVQGGITLDLAGKTLTANNLNTTGTITGSNTSSLVINGTASTLSFASGKEQLLNLTLGASANVTLTSLLNITSSASGVGTVTLGANSTLNTGGFLTLNSTISGTAQIAQLGTGATISGDATIERYIADKRGWRLITPSVVSSQTIDASWQENAGGLGTDPKPGYGTFIIGGTTANGFDNAGTSASLLAFNGTVFNSVPNTIATPVSTNTAYFLFCIGSRSINPATAGVHSSTVLRAKGTVVTGTVPPATIAASGSFTLVGNPYPAAVDFSKITRSSNVPDQFYAWDINLGTYGGYVLISNTGGGTYTSVPTSPSGLNKIIPQGGAVFLSTNNASTGTLSADESIKATTNTFANFSTYVANNTQHNFRVNLTDANSNLVDGVMANYDAGNSNLVDGNDAPKLTNFYENISLSRSGKQLTLERRSDITAKDTLFVQLSGVKVANYQLQLNPADFNEPGMIAYVEDAYLHTRTLLDLTQVTNLPFSTTADAASYKDRFEVTFSPATTPVIATKTSHIGASVVAYPNPAVQKQINLSFDGLPAGEYNVTVTNTFGQVMQKNSVTYSGDASSKQLKTDYSTGVYTVNIQSAGYNQSIKVIIP